MTVESAFESLIEAQKKIAELKSFIADQDKIVDACEKFLESKIPAGAVKGGVQHIVTTRSSTAYAKVLAAVREQFVPKTKSALVDEIVERFTSVSEQHKYKAVE